MQEYNEEPHALYGLTKALCRPLRQIGAHSGNSQIVPLLLFLAFLRQFPCQFRIAKHKANGSFQYQLRSQIIFLMFPLRPAFTLLRFGKKPGRSLFQPFLHIGTDMSLCVILLIQLSYYFTVPDLFRQHPPNVILQRLPLPKGHKLFKEIGAILRPYQKTILRS